MNIMRRESHVIDVAAPGRRSPIEALRDRLEKTKRWLAENAPDIDEHQAHLDKGTPEEAYWQYGYFIALRDALNLLEQNKEPLS